MLQKSTTDIKNTVRGLLANTQYLLFMAEFTLQIKPMNAVGVERLLASAHTLLDTKESTTKTKPINGVTEKTGLSAVVPALTQESFYRREACEGKDCRKSFMQSSNTCQHYRMYAGEKNPWGHGCRETLVDTGQFMQ